YAIALQSGLSERLALCYKKACYLHDYGKIFLPAELINKQGPLTDAEYEIVQYHISTGFDALARTRIRGRSICADVALFHHERLNGSGYIGLQRNAICTASRIVAIADVFDAMTHDRPYKKAKSQNEALAYFNRYAGFLFDESYVQALNILLRIRNSQTTSKQLFEGRIQ
ncbi:MAG: HD domain-containing phosphohydrolase, partial [Clostridiaceae bacterium]